jgi:hypothetical protein
MTDVFSRCMMNSKAGFQHLHPSAFIWIRLIMTMVWDTHLLYRLFQIESKLDSFKSLEQLRNALNKEGSFGFSIGQCALNYQVLLATPPIPTNNAEPATPGGEGDAEVINFKGKLKDTSKNKTKVDWLNSAEGVAARKTGHHTLDLLPNNSQRLCLYCSNMTRYHCKACHKATGNAKVYFPVCNTPCFTPGNRKCIKLCTELIHGSSDKIVPDASRKKMVTEGKLGSILENQAEAATARKRKRTPSPVRSISSSQHTDATINVNLNFAEV